MMRIKEKLNSNAGASMMLALALLLVCVVVSSIIITAATSGASRNLRRTQQQREYLAVSSAAELLQKNLKDVGKIGGTTEINVHACQELEQQGDDDWIEVTDSNEVPEGFYRGYLVSKDITGVYVSKLLVIEGPNDLTGQLCTSSNILNMETEEFYGPYAELMRRAAVHVFEKKLDYKESFYITVKGESERLPEVRCDFTMNQAYTVKIDIYVDGGVSDYSMTLELPAMKTETDNGDTNEVTCSHMVLSIEEIEGGNVNPKLQMEEFVQINECPTILIEWKGVPKISKGGQ